MVEQAVIERNLNISQVNESENGRRVTLTVSQGQKMGNKEIQDKQGTVRIIKLSSSKTRVEIMNPDYHFSVPQYERDDYQDMIFSKLESLLKTQG